MASTSNVSLEAGKPPRENLYRINPDIGLERSAGAGMPTMVGHFAVWDQWTEIRSAYEGNFMERFTPSSMSKTLSEQRPKVLFNHGKDPQIGDKVLGTPARVAPDAHGASYEVPLFDTTYNRDLVPGLEAGEYGASFRFSVMQEDVNMKPARSEQNPRGIPERTVTEARVMEFGPVTFPAYAGASAGIRSITDDFLAAQLFENDAVVERLAERLAKKTRTFSVSFNGTKVTNAEPAERTDAEAVALLNQMTDLGQQFLDLETDDPEDTADRETMNQILAQITALTDEEQAEPDDGDGTSSDDGRAKTPEPSEATTSTEPEPSEATTRSQDEQAFKFLFVKPPKHLRSN